MAIIPYSTVQNIERLPIDAQDVVTRVRLVIAGNIGGTWESEFIRTVDDWNLLGSDNTGNNVDPFPLPMVYQYEAPEHSALGAERSFALPEGTNPFLPPEHANVGDPSIVSNFTNPGAIRDGDPLTYAENSGSGTYGAQISYQTLRPSCGYKLRYSLTGIPLGQSLGALHRHRSASPTTVRTIANRKLWSYPETGGSDTATDVYAITLHDARGEDENLGDGWQRVSDYTISMSTDGGAQLRIYAYYPLILNEPLLERIAKSNVRLPAANPSRVTVTGIIAPNREHTITGWPGGDFTGKVAQQQYELGRTVIDFEQAGAPTGLPAEAVEAARERSVAVRSEIQRAGYSLKMGERA